MHSAGTFGFRAHQRVRGPQGVQAGGGPFARTTPCPQSDKEPPPPARAHLHPIRLAGPHFPSRVRSEVRLWSMRRGRSRQPRVPTAVARQPSAALSQSEDVLLPRSPAPDGGTMVTGGQSGDLLLTRSPAPGRGTG